MRLILSSEHVRDATFTDSHGQVLYKTDTPFRLGSRTTTLSKIRPSRGFRDHFEVLGTIKWHKYSSTVFRFGGNELKTKDFIPSGGVLRRKRTFTGPDGRSYRWELGSKVVVLYLNSTFKTEVARLHRRSLGIIGRKKSPYLEVSPQVEHMLDLIILTFIYVEKLRMDKEKASESVSVG
ncbi:hypothetical protein BV22DRAFT_1049898 [Leucogyrophana mollusca]|uniref:Uncharacterized protein n=1 Tax=Leucogyrophana mollusca TaxID=85980 RepID=A0ACB8B6B3_9AGAM|nr:hypothetical protein BV22DRAFT_1049898 [Leucogyrophana mollusca]